MGGVHKHLSAVGVAMGVAVGTSLVAMIDRAVGAVVGFFAKGITGAANLAESITKLQEVFGAEAYQFTNLADQMARDFGLPKQAILDAASSFGLMGRAAGQSQAQAAQMGVTLARLAADASSFYNVPMDVALEKIRSGLAGEALPMRDFGVLLSEEAVKQEALRLGLIKTSKELDDNAKVMARASLITKGLQTASGDLERTAGSTANQWRKFTGDIGNLATSIGTALAPAINKIINTAGDMTKALSDSFESSKGYFAAFAEHVIEGVNTVQKVWRNLPLYWDIVAMKFKEGVANIVQSLAVLPENLATIGKWIGSNWLKMIADAVEAVFKVFKNLGTNIQKLGEAIKEWLSNPTAAFKTPNWTPLLEGYKAVTAALPKLAQPAWVSYAKEIADIQNNIDKAEVKRAEDTAARITTVLGAVGGALATAGRTATQQAQDALGAIAGGLGMVAAKERAKKTADTVAEKTAEKEKEFKSETVGVAEFASKLRESIFSAKDDTAKKQLEANERTAKAAEATVEQLKKGVPAILS